MDNNKVLDFEKTTGWGQITGLAGVNCRHSWTSYLPGVSPAPPTAEELAEQHARDKATKPYKWTDKRGKEHEKDFTMRDALDRQREMERRMRQTRKEAKALETAGLTDDATALKIRYRSQLREYEKFSKVMGIITQKNRIYMDGIGRVL